MAARKMKWSPPRGVALAGLTLAAVVVACDTNAPTALDDALLDVLANPEAAVDADGADSPGALQIRGALGDGAPLIFVDGVESEAGGAALSSLNPDDIESIEVIKGEAAADLHGERAENGVIRILTKESRALDPGEPSADAGRAPGDGGSGGPRIRIRGTGSDGMAHGRQFGIRTGQLVLRRVPPLPVLGDRRLVRPPLLEPLAQV